MCLYCIIIYCIFSYFVSEMLLFLNFFFETSSLHVLAKGPKIECQVSWYKTTISFFFSSFSLDMDECENTLGCHWCNLNAKKSCNSECRTGER